MTKRVAILQSNYLPWKGYFDIINMVDLFVFHDDLQYTKGDWRNRNRIKTPNGLQWLTIPCGSSEKRLICEVCLEDHQWQRKHWNLIVANYQKAPQFHCYSSFFQEVYLHRTWKSLSELNQYLITNIARSFLGIRTAFDDSRRYNLQFAKGERVLELLQKVGADVYLSGPAAKSYLDAEKLARCGITVEWMEYNETVEYPQLHGPFERNVSIIDVLFNCGPQAADFIRKMP